MILTSLISKMRIISANNFQFEGYKDPDVIRCWEWFLSFISKEEWLKRKADIEELISVEYDKYSLSQPIEGPILVTKQDQIGWYLYLTDVFINEPYKYEYFQGARVMPIFKRIGADIDLLVSIDGVKKKVRELMKSRKSEADAILFEILTALIWARNGWKVKFLEEGRKEGKMPDLHAKKGAEEWFIECKRHRKTPDYTYKETAKRQKMISHLSPFLMEKNIRLNITFHEELINLPDTYLKDILKDKLALMVFPGKIISNNVVDIDLDFIDIKVIKRHLSEYSVKNPSPQLNALISNKPVDNKSLTSGMYAQQFRIGNSEVYNLYVSDIEKAFGVICNCDAKEALLAKAKDIKKQIQTALNQFNVDSKSIIHIGIETYDGPNVEAERLKKIEFTLNQLNPKQTNLRWIFCHFFQSYSSPEEPWTFDETVMPFSPYMFPISPLRSKFMVIPDDSDTAKVPHWDRPLP